jgi:hypothetical protein
VKNLLLVTSETPFPPPTHGFPRSKVLLHVPAAETEAQAASLLCGLYPGRIVLAGERNVRSHTFLEAFARQGIPVYADVPPAFSFLLPETVRDLTPDMIGTLTTPHVAWLHRRGRVPHNLWAKAAYRADRATVACVTFARGRGRYALSRQRGSGHFSFPLREAGVASILDISPTVAGVLGASLPLGDGVDLSWEEDRADRPFFGEDWLHADASVTQGGYTLTCHLADRPIPWAAAQALWWFGIGPRGRRAARTIWDARRLVEAASRLRPVPVALVRSPGSRGGTDRQRLLGLLEAHLARYTGRGEAEVLERLRDLGYL